MNRERHLHCTFPQPPRPVHACMCACMCACVQAQELRDEYLAEYLARLGEAEREYAAVVEGARKLRQGLQEVAVAQGANAQGK
jgi:hypothetical protein